MALSDSQEYENRVRLSVSGDGLTRSQYCFRHKLFDQHDAIDSPSQSIHGEAYPLSMSVTTRAARRFVTICSCPDAK